MLRYAMVVGMILCLVMKAHASVPKVVCNASAIPSRLSIEYGGDILVVGDSPGEHNDPETCVLSRMYGSGVSFSEFQSHHHDA